MSCLRLSTGFQFNHVGGGTKTRRPITLHMKYNSSAVQPTCFLLTEDSGEQEVSLEELQVNAQGGGRGRIAAIVREHRPCSQTPSPNEKPTELQMP